MLLPPRPRALLFRTLTPPPLTPRPRQLLPETLTQPRRRQTVDLSAENPQYPTRTVGRLWFLRFRRHGPCPLTQQDLHGDHRHLRLTEGQPRRVELHLPLIQRPFVGPEKSLAAPPH